MIMKRRIISMLTAAALAVPAVFTGSVGENSADAASAVTISPYSVFDINGGKFEGWGTSLCWWANRIGYSDSLAQQAADAFYGDNGLRLNIARYNIGGGDDPSHNHITRTDSDVPGYTVYNNGQVTYDWNADAEQRNVLMKCIEACGDDMIVEMFSNSPPYYMTNSGCSSGNTNPGANNLKDDCYDDFAEYMAEVCYHFKNEWGVDIQSVEPMNEPYTNFWGAGSAKQEGCHFDEGESESRIIVELQKAMAAKGMEDIMICGTDETSIDTQISCYKKLSQEAKNAIGRIDTHTYGGSNRSGLRELARSEGKNLWMSEVDGNGTAGQNAGEMAAALWLAERINTDVNELNCSAWIIWQVIDKHICEAGYKGRKDSGMPDISTGFWGTAVADHDKDMIVLTKKYYAFGQYSRYIRPGMTMLRSSGNNMVAYDPEKGQLVIVAINDKGSAQESAYDLTQFETDGAKASLVRTSSTENWADVGTVDVENGMLSSSLAPNSITTFIIDGVSGGGELTGRIDVSSDGVKGSDPWKSNADYDCRKAFDGNNSSYFDGLTNGWIEADLGDTYELTAIGYCPRSGYEYRCQNGRFLISDDGENWKEFCAVGGKPSSGMHYITRFAEKPVGRYIRYEIPESAEGDSDTNCCNIAEIEVYGSKPELPPEKIRGDVNADGELGIADYVMLHKFLLGAEELTDSEAADLDENGRVDVFDQIRLGKLVFKT